MSIARTIPALTTFSSDWGWIACLWRQDHLLGMTFARGNLKKAIEDLPTGRIPSLNKGVWDMGEFAQGSDTQSAAQQELQNQVLDYTTGKSTDFRAVKLYIADMTPFQQQVIRQCRKIPYGQTLTYGQLAAKAGSPRAARAVGSVMARNRYPLIVPCHRVVASGSLGGFSSPEGIALKKKLLHLEGCESGRF